MYVLILRERERVCVCVCFLCIICSIIWAQGNDLRCALCKSCVDNHSHLFFECPYSWKVWNVINRKGRCIRGGNSLNSVVNHLAASPLKNNIWQIVDKLILSSTVYHIWNERNKRTFQNVMRTEDELLVAITGISKLL